MSQFQDGTEAAPADGLSASVDTSQPHPADEPMKRPLLVDDIDDANLDVKRARYETDGL